MTTLTDPAAHTPTRRRIIAFRMICGLVLAAFAFALPNALTPWVGTDFQGDGLIEPWRDAFEGTVDAIVWIAGIGLLLKPLARQLTAQFVALSILVATAMVLPAAGPAFLFTAVMILAIVAAYPSPARLLDTRSVTVNRPLMTIAVLAAAVLVPVGVSVWSATDASAATYAEHLIILAMAGPIAATSRPGWRWVASPTAAAWAYLGVVSLAFPEEADSFGLVGGIACLAVATGMAVSLRPR